MFISKWTDSFVPGSFERQTATKRVREDAKARVLETEIVRYPFTSRVSELSKNR